MARIRSIHPDALKSEKLAVAGAEAERCYWRLTTICDDYGRVEDHPRLIWATLFPLNDDATTELVDQWLSELAEVGLVERYTSGGKRCIAVTRWSDYQHPRHSVASVIPPPEDRDNPPEAYGEPPIGVGVGEGEGVGEGVGGAQESSTALMVRPPTQVFDEFWEHYPRKIGKGEARKAFEKASKRVAAVDWIIAGAVRFEQFLTVHATEQKFVPYPATWLNRDGWEDDLTLEDKPVLPRNVDMIGRALERMGDG